MLRKRELAFDPAASGPTHRRAAVGARQHAADSLRPRLRLAWCDQVALATVLDDLARPADCGRYDRNFERQRLDDGPPERLLPRRQQQHVERAHDLRHVLALAEPHDAVLETGIDDQSAQAREIGLVVIARRRRDELRAADQQQPRVDVLRAQQRQRLDRGLLALPRADLRDDAQQRRPPIGCCEPPARGRAIDPLRVESL